MPTPVIMPDGTEVMMPDKLTPEERLELEKLDTVSFFDMVKGGGKAALAGFGEAAAQLPEAFTSVVPLPLQPLVKPFAKSLAEPAKATYKEMGTEATQEIGRFPSAVLKGMGGAAAGGPGMGARNIVAGGLAGLGAEAGKPFGPVGEILGGLTGGLSTGLGGMAKTNRAALARETLEGVAPNDLATAVKAMGTAKAAGVPINLSQAMPRASNIDDILAELAQSKQGDAVISQLRAQPEALMGLSRKAQASVPGPITSPQLAANQMQEAATGALTRAKQARSDAVTRLYDKAGDLGITGPVEMVKMIQNQAARPGTSPAVQSALKQLEEQILTNPATGASRTHATDIKAALDEFRSNIKSEIFSKDAMAQGQIKHFYGELNKILADQSPPLKAANAAYAAISDAKVNPLKQFLRPITGTRGAQPDQNAVASSIFGILKRGTPEGGKSAISQLEETVRAVDPTAFPTLVKTHIADTIDSAMKSQTSRPNENFAANVYNALYSSPQQQRGMRDMLAGVAKSQGLPEADVVRGFENFLRLSGHIAKQPAKITGMPRQDIQEVAGASKAASVLEVQYWTQTGRKIRRAFSGDAYRTMDKLLTSPEGVETLKKLAETPIISPAAATAVGTFYGTLGNMEGEE